jgi:hypothetical protein
MQEVQRLAVVVDQVNQALGLQQGSPPEPLLWLMGGHPPGAPSLDLWEAGRRLEALCETAMAAGVTSQASRDLIQAVAAERLSGNIGMGQHPQGCQLVGEEEVSAVTLMLSADWGLRRALLEGLALFSMALAMASGRKEAAARSHIADTGPEEIASYAHQIVASLQKALSTTISQVILQCFIGACTYV